VVVVREDAPGARELVAYVVLREKMQAHRAELARLTEQQLPTCPPPSAFVFLEALPLAQNGTPDLRRLPPPLRDDAPRTRLEEAVASVWTQVLSREAGMHDDFFALGGNSLLAMQVMAKLRAALGVEIPLNAFFEDPTAAHLARLIEHLQGSGQAAAHLPLAAVSRANYRVPEGG
jgi:acyl carrier protein